MIVLLWVVGLYLIVVLAGLVVYGFVWLLDLFGVA